MDPKALVLGAAAGFDGSVSELSRRTGVPMRTLNNLANGTNGGSAALIALLKIFSANPGIAGQLCRDIEHFDLLPTSRAFGA